MFDFFFQAEDGIRDVLGSRGLGDVYKRQGDYRGFWSAVNKNSPETVITWDSAVNLDRRLDCGY